MTGVEPSASLEELVDYLRGGDEPPQAAVSGSEANPAGSPEHMPNDGDKPQSQIAVSAGSAMLAEVANSLVTHPEIGIAVQAGFQSENPVEQRAAWRRIERAYGSFTGQSKAESKDAKRQEFTLRILGALARGRTVQALMPRLRQEGTVTGVEDVYHMWAAMSSELRGFLSPDFKETHWYRKQTEMVRFDKAFGDAPSDTLAKGLLRLTGARPEFTGAVAGYFSQEATPGALSTSLRRGLSFLGELSTRTYRHIYGTVASDDPGVLAYMLREVDDERVAFERLTGVGANGFAVSRSYTGFIKELKESGNPNAERIIRRGLHRMLSHYVKAYNTDVSKLLAAIGHPPVEVDNLAVPHLRIRMTEKQKRHALAAMSPEALDESESA